MDNGILNYGKGNIRMRNKLNLELYDIWGEKYTIEIECSGYTEEEIKVHLQIFLEKCIREKKLQLSKEEKYMDEPLELILNTVVQLMEQYRRLQEKESINEDIKDFELLMLD